MEQKSNQWQEKLYNKRYIFEIGAVLLLLAVPALGFSQYVIRILIMIGIYTMLALGFNILTGLTGLVSLGHAGFFAIGAYATAILMIKMQMNFFLAVFIAMIITGICGLLLGLPTLRLTGTYLSIVTLGFAEIVKMIIMNWDSMTNGTLGIRNIPKPTMFGEKLTLANNGMYYLMLLLLFLVTFTCITIHSSKIGRALKAIKANELASSMMGIYTARYKVLAFVISAVITGLAGGFYAALVSYIDHNSFTFDTSILILSIVILGGMGTIRGMFLGAAILISFPEVARPLMEWRFVVYGLILILMMRFRPQGLLGWRSTAKYRIPKDKEGKKRGGKHGIS
ncbi:branched-chain amino acid ABC transporter permease [Anaerocolumna sp.]|uniref:branched-chain amino acid ABC transporter permease n=1 Tax=Anaerocolumna sp. TaxID=2041569 RepID=UPI0028A97DE4|nr:branched-chain amino acid ABC transporter permease [Anaerocolumna sp.]